MGDMVGGIILSGKVMPFHTTTGKIVGNILQKATLLRYNNEKSRYLTLHAGGIEMERFCTSCGAPIPAGAKFCVGCGRAINVQPAPQRPQVPQTPPRRSQPVRPVNPPQPAKTMSWQIIVLIVVAALALAAGVFFAVRYLGSAGKAETQHTEYVPEEEDTPAQEQTHTELPAQTEYTPAQETPAPETQEEETPAQELPDLLAVSPYDLKWTTMTGFYDLEFSIPKGFYEGIMHTDMHAHGRVFDSTELDMYIRIQEAPAEYRSAIAASPGGDVSPTQLGDNALCYYYLDETKDAYIKIYETWGSQYAYSVGLQWPNCTGQQAQAYENLADAILAHVTCNNTIDESSEYILPQSETRRLTEDDLSGLTHEELCLARNEIYARHGRRFKTQAIAAYFADKSWYDPSVDPAVFDANQESYLSEDERYNASFLLSYEKQKFGKSYY